MYRDARIQAKGFERKQQARMAPLLEKWNELEGYFNEENATEICDFLNDINFL